MAVGFAGGVGGRRTGVDVVGGRHEGHGDGDGGGRGDGGAGCCAEGSDRTGCGAVLIFVVVLMLMPPTCATARRGRRSFLHDCCGYRVSASEREILKAVVHDENGIHEYGTGGGAAIRIRRSRGDAYCRERDWGKNISCFKSEALFCLACDQLTKRLLDIVMAGRHFLWFLRVC